MIVGGLQNQLQLSNTTFAELMHFHSPLLWDRSIQGIFFVTYIAFIKGSGAQMQLSETVELFFPFLRGIIMV